MECKCRHVVGPEVSGLSLRPGPLIFQLCDMGYVTQFLISITDLLLKRNESVKVVYKTLILLSLPAYCFSTSCSVSVHRAFFKQFSQISSLALILSSIQTPSFGFSRFSHPVTKSTSRLAVSCAYTPDLSVHLDLDKFFSQVHFWPCRALVSCIHSYPTKRHVDSSSHQGREFRKSQFITKEAEKYPDLLSWRWPANRDI